MYNDVQHMSIGRKSTFFLGIFIFVIPFLGFPSLWKEIFTAISGIFLILLSVKIAIPKKANRYKTQREKVTPVFVESIPTISPRNDTVEVASQVVDIKPTPKRARVTKKSNGPAI